MHFQGKRISHNIYAQTREECEKKARNADRGDEGWDQSGDGEKETGGECVKDSGLTNG